MRMRSNKSLSPYPTLCRHCGSNLFTIIGLHWIGISMMAGSLLFQGCGRPLNSSEQNFLGSWETTVTEEHGVNVVIIWTFVFENDKRRLVINEIYEDNRLMSRRSGEWHVIDSTNLRVVLDSQNLHVTDNYENSGSSPIDDSFGQLIGSIFGELLTALTDNEYNIEYYRDGIELYMRWYNHEYQAYRSLPNG